MILQTHSKNTFPKKGVWFFITLSDPPGLVKDLTFPDFFSPSLSARLALPPISLSIRSQSRRPSPCTSTFWGGPGQAQSGNFNMILNSSSLQALPVGGQGKKPCECDIFATNVRIQYILETDIVGTLHIRSFELNYLDVRRATTSLEVLAVALQRWNFAPQSIASLVFSVV